VPSSAWQGEVDALVVGLAVCENLRPSSKGLSHESRAQALKTKSRWHVTQNRPVLPHSGYYTAAQNRDGVSSVSGSARTWNSDVSSSAKEWVDPMHRASS
jgi:hypothetical protein